MDELTEEMHSEFWIDAETEKWHKAWAAFGLLAAGVPLPQVLTSYQITAADLTPYVEQWNASSAKQINLDRLEAGA